MKRGVVDRLGSTVKGLNSLHLAQWEWEATGHLVLGTDQKVTEAALSRSELASPSEPNLKAPGQLG